MALAASRNRHPSSRKGLAPRGRAARVPAVTIPRDRDSAVLDVGGRQVQLTNLKKPFWPELGIAKGDLLQYYADVAPLLLPHVRDRAMVMKRYPNGAYGEFFLMKQCHWPAPAWSDTCRLRERSS